MSQQAGNPLKSNELHSFPVLSEKLLYGTQTASEATDGLLSALFSLFFSWRSL